MSPKTLTAIDLFCGAGGLTEGLKQAGFNVLAGVEINKIAVETYKLNHPEVQCFDIDIKKLSSKEILESLNLKVGDLDLLAGCPPCQGFSSLRTRNKSISLDDERNDLIFEFLRLTESLMPKCVMLENVPALAKDERIEKVISKLKILGYFIDDTSLQVEDVSDYGVPQRRRRMILKASRIALLGNTEKAKEKLTVRKCFEHANLKPVGLSNDCLHDYEQKRSQKVKDIIHFIPKDGGSRIELPEHLILDCHKRNPKSFTDVYGRMKWDSVAPTITGGCNSPSKGRFLHPEEDRCITLREAALLQTFPKTYKFPKASQAAIALMIGNALPPEFIRRQAMTLKIHLSI
ncbi:DNA cytosine methyltransferase [Acinetobacter brisouii]